MPAPSTDGSTSRQGLSRPVGAGDLNLESLCGGRLFIAGAGTQVGQSLVRVLRGVTDIEVCGLDVSDPELRDARAIERVFDHEQPTHIVVAAGRSGGISANRRLPVDLMIDNLRVVAAVIPAAHRCGVRALLYVASSCVYPRHAPQPMSPEALWSGVLEPTSEAYSVAKLAGLVLCQAYRDQHGVRFVTGIAGDAFGPGADFDPENSHVVAGMLRRMHEARTRGDATFVVWGTGRQIRDLVYVDDLARACLLALSNYDERGPVNLSSGTGTSIAELAAVVREVIGFGGELVFDTSRPDGAPLKVLDAGPIRRLGFAPQTTLRAGVELTYEWFLKRFAQSAHGT